VRRHSVLATSGQKSAKNRNLLQNLALNSCAQAQCFGYFGPKKREKSQTFANFCKTWPPNSCAQAQCFGYFCPKKREKSQPSAKPGSQFLCTASENTAKTLCCRSRAAAPANRNQLISKVSQHRKSTPRFLCIANQPRVDAGPSLPPTPAA
jgi:hypothetical protein